MRAVLDYCTGGVQRAVSAGTLVLHEGSTTGHLFVLIEGRLEVIKGDTVVASITEQAATRPCRVLTGSSPSSQSSRQ